MGRGVANDRWDKMGFARSAKAGGSEEQRWSQS
jgi:hypothetical protein